MDAIAKDPQSMLPMSQVEARGVHVRVISRIAPAAKRAAP